MKHFTTLCTQLGQATKSHAKSQALARYFEQASDEDKLWAIAILSHRRPKRAANSALLKTWAVEMAGLPLWLFEESLHVAGDLSEAIALFLPGPVAETNHSLTYWIEYIKGLDRLEEAEKKEQVMAAWKEMGPTERMVFNKLITGGFRIGVSQKLMVQALSLYTGIDENTLAHRLMGNWAPGSTSFSALFLASAPLEDVSKPYPFYLAYPLEGEPQTLGAPSEWQAERKWDGIRGQLIVRRNELFVWSREEELVTDRFPEYCPLAQLLPDGTVLDGEILPFRDGRPLSFNDLQARIGRKSITKSTLKKTPVVMMVYDLLEWQGEDIRNLPLHERRQLLELLMETYDSQGVLLLSETIPFDQWESLAREWENAREHHSVGLMLKRKDSIYQAGRKKGGWWKWKADPLTVDAVMIYAQSGQGSRAGQFTDFTFAVWDGDTLVPFAKADSGLTDNEFREISAWVRRNTRERFGPARSLEPTYVFEIAFDGIRASSRHKSGVALRLPRISRWRKDKPIREANTLEDLHALLPVPAPRSS